MDGLRRAPAWRGSTGSTPVGAATPGNIRIFASSISRRGSEGSFGRQGRTRGRALVLGAALFLSGQWAKATSADAGAGRPALDALPAPPLPELVEPALPSADGAALARLDLLLDQLLAPGLKTRTDAAALVRAVDASWLPAIAERFEHVAGAANKPALKVLLDTIRKRSRAELGPSRGAPASPPLDNLDAIVAYADRSSAFLRPLTEVIAYSRMFEAIGSLPAARRIIGVYVYFGEFLRADTELALARLGEGAIAALIETSAHPTPRIAAWAKAQLEAMGKHVASEAVQVRDLARRADILRAYGKTRDVETTRLLISFAASEVAPIRLAARQAVALHGELALWHLRDAYAKSAGARAPSNWSWRRVAEELFAEFDRQRLADIYRLFHQGRAAAERGDLTAAGAAFDQVLAFDPLFERGPAMAPVYLAIAERQLDADPDAASLSLRRAERLAREGQTHDRALSLRHTLDARALLARGIVDEVLVQRARELWPDNARAEALETELRTRALGERGLYQRYVGAAAVLALALLALGIMAFRQRRGSKSDAAPAAPR